MSSPDEVIVLARLSLLYGLNFSILLCFFRAAGSACRVLSCSVHKMSSDCFESTASNGNLTIRFLLFIDGLNAVSYPFSGAIHVTEDATVITLSHVAKS